MGLGKFLYVGGMRLRRIYEKHRAKQGERDMKHDLYISVENVDMFNVTLSDSQVIKIQIRFV